MNKVQLLASMEGRETTQDWGAISIFGRARLNRLLEQQFVESFDELSFLPAFSMEKIYLSTDETEWISLDSLILSKPLLSFETASLDNAQATLTLGIMSGTVTTFTKPVGKPATLLSSFKVSEQQGYTLVMTVNLHMVVGEVDARGRVTLDLKNSLSFKCNLAEQLHAQNRIGDAFEGFLKGLPRHKRVFELGTLALKGYNPLAPTSFRILTQAAPGAKDARAFNYGAGGVLIFIALRGKPSPGYLPGEGSGFPYFIPDDQDSQGRDLYSAALVLSHDMLEHVEQDRLDLLNSLLFPGENIFVESSRHIPKDLIVFGNIDPTLTSITLDPLFKVIHAGSTLQFTVRQAGRALKAETLEWTVRSLNSHKAAGKFSSTTPGLYQSVSAQQLGKQTVRNVVTARYTDSASGEERRASALLAVTFEAITVAPQASIHYVGGASRTVELFAVTLGDGELIWTPLAPVLGSLDSQGARATYTPPAQLPEGQAVAVQRIQVQDSRSGFKVEASVLLLGASQTVNVTPAHVPGLGRSGEVQLAITNDYPPDSLRWSVISGTGLVSDTGLFKAPLQLDSATSVVCCELVYAGSVWGSGYSVIELSDFVQELTWNGLKNFQLTASSGHNKALSNGYQQIVVDILTETESEEGVTLEEISSLEIVAQGGQALEYLPKSQQGLTGDEGLSWAVKNDDNDFNTQDNVATSGGAADATWQTRAEVDGKFTRATVYVHTLARDAATFYARFHDAFNTPHNSNEKSQLPPRTLELEPLTVPQFNEQMYTFSPIRAAGGSQTNKNPPSQEDYDYFLNTTDYWYLEFNGVPGLSPAARFVRCEFEDNQSTLQWESRRVNETMFSYTGYIFNEEGTKDDPTVMRYDARLSRVMPGITLKPEIESEQAVGDGQLMISLFRVDNVKYTAQEPAASLEKPLTLLLLDKNGNAHRLSIAFLSMDVADSRNTLQLSVI